MGPWPECIFRSLLQFLVNMILVTFLWIRFKLWVEEVILVHPRFETYPYTDQLIYMPASTNILIW